MTYVVSNTDGSLTLAIEDGTINGTDYSVVLLGKNVIDYGRYIAQNSIRQLESFAGTTPPTPATVLVGQLWFDKTTSTLKVYNNVWRPVSTQQAQVDKIITYSSINNLPANANIQYAAAVFNNVDKKLYIDNGTRIQVAGYGGEVTSRYSTSSVLGRPNNYGTRVRTIYLTDTADVPRAVLALVYVNDTSNGSMNRGTTTTKWGKETIMMLVSDHDEFTVKNTTSYTEGEDINYYAELDDVNGIGTTIVRGSNTRKDYGTSIQLANQAYEANVAYWLNTGSFGSPSPSGYFHAGNVIHTGRSYTPAIPDTYSLGTNSNRFQNGYINNLTTYNLLVGNNQSNPSGTGYTLPTGRGVSGQVLTTNGAGGTSWTTVASGGGTIGSTTLAGLNDVQLSSPANDQLLKYNSATSKWVNATNNLNSISDVVLTAPTNGQVLKFNGTNWVNGTDATSSGGTITIPGSNGQLLYNDSGDLGALSTLTYASGTPNQLTLTGLFNTSSLTVTGTSQLGSPVLFTKAASANEGGEIHLQKPTTGSSLIGDLTIDLYQNKVRIFDGGGTYKGLFATITTCADAVGSEIVHSTNFQTFYNNATTGGRVLAWVKFNGQGVFPTFAPTVLAKSNSVTSVVRLSTGKYRVNFVTGTFTDEHYVVSALPIHGSNGFDTFMGTSNGTGNGSQFTLPVQTQNDFTFTVGTWISGDNAALYDCGIVHLAFIR